jgi:hypothetical protein
VLSGIFFVFDDLYPAKKASAENADGRSGPGAVQNLIKALSPMLRERCVNSAKAALSQQGINAAVEEIGAKVESYCACAIGHSSAELSITELLAFKLNPSSEPAASKMKNIIRECQDAIGGSGQ